MTQQKSEKPVWVIYILGWVTGLIFALTEKNDENVKWHAANAIAIYGAIAIIFVISNSIRFFLFDIISILAGIAAIIIFVMIIVKDRDGERYRVPILTDFAETTVSKWFK